MPGVDFNVLRTEVTMEDVLRQLRFQPTSRSGDQLHGPCPVHGSTSPGSRTFSVNLANGRYYCHKCHSRGNHLELWAEVHKLSLYRCRLGPLPRPGPRSPLASPLVTSPSQSEQQRRLPWGNLTTSVSAYLLRAVSRRLLRERESVQTERQGALSVALASPDRHSGT
jgi:hypothetical protein